MKLEDFAKKENEKKNVAAVSAIIPIEYRDFIKEHNIPIRRLIMKAIEELREEVANENQNQNIN